MGSTRWRRGAADEGGSWVRAEARHLRIEWDDDVVLDLLERLDELRDTPASRLYDGGAAADALRTVVVEGTRGDAELVVEAL